jgi:FkbM family methyltransferase
MMQSLDPRFNTIIEAAIWGKSGEKKKFNISSNSESSSLLELGTHAQSYPTIHFTEVIEVTTKSLDDIFIDNKIQAEKIFLNLDIQGAELEALKGAESLLKNVHFIYTEVNREEVYKGCATVEELDTFLKHRGFVRVATRWIIRAGWGDALYMKKRDLPRTLLSLILSGNFYIRQIIARGVQKARQSLTQSKPSAVGNENG